MEKQKIELGKTKQQQQQQQQQEQSQQLLKNRNRQYLIDWKTFYNTKTHSLYPSALCFPQFFKFSILSLSSKYLSNNPNYHTYAKSFFTMLPWMVNEIFSTSLSLLSPELCEEKLRNIKLSPIENYFLDISECPLILEHYLADEESIYEYRKSLLDITLTYSKQKNISDYIQYLIKTECCLKDCNSNNMLMPPSSDCYVLIPDSNINAKISYAIEMWGPIYWNIFHKVGEIEEGLNEHKDKSYFNNIEIIQNSFIHLLPAIIPCQMCSVNYHRHVKPSDISYFSNLHSKEIYHQIHWLVTQHKKT